MHADLAWQTVGYYYSDIKYVCIDVQVLTQYIRTMSCQPTVAGFEETVDTERADRSRLPPYEKRKKVLDVIDGNDDYCTY